MNIISEIRANIRTLLSERVEDLDCDGKALPIFKSRNKLPSECIEMSKMTDAELLGYIATPEALKSATRAILGPVGAQRLTNFIDELERRGLARKLSDSSFLVSTNKKGDNVLKMQPNYAKWLMFTLLRQLSPDNPYVQQATKGISDVSKDFIWDNAYRMRELGFYPFFDQLAARYLMRIIKSRLSDYYWNSETRDIEKIDDYSEPLKVGDTIQDVPVKLVKVSEELATLDGKTFKLFSYIFLSKQRVYYKYRSPQEYELVQGQVYLIDATVRFVGSGVYGIKNLKLTKSKKVIQ